MDKYIKEEVRMAVMYQYHGQNILRKWGEDNVIQLWRDFNPAIFYLEAKSIKNISEQHLNELSEILVVLSPEAFIEHLINDYTYACRPNRTIQAYQFLIQAGYAMPFADYTIERLVNAGVYKIANT
jgi:hypothetical protein